jgi:hypothetical protein
MTQRGIECAGRARNSLSVVHPLHLRHVILPLPSLAPPTPTPETLRPRTERCPSSHAQSYIRLHLKCEEAWVMGR